MWNMDNMMPFLKELKSIDETAVTVDMLKLINLKPNGINLECAVILLFLINNILFGNQIEFICVACDSLLIFSKRLRDSIKSALSASQTVKTAIEDR